MPSSTARSRNGGRTGNRTVRGTEVPTDETGNRQGTLKGEADVGEEVNG